MKKAVHFGAGNIGRGFLGQLLTESGYRVVFAEINPVIIRELQNRGEYTLMIAGDRPRDIRIKNVSAVDARDGESVSREIASADIVSTSVGAAALGQTAPLIAGGIILRAGIPGGKSLNVIICENMLDAGDFLRRKVRENLPPGYRAYLDKNVGFVETVVSRMIPIVPEKIRRGDPLFIMAEEYGVLPASKKSFAGEIPKIKGLLPRDDIVPYTERKLFVHNLGHAVCAYNGFLGGHSFIWEAVSDPAINRALGNALGESSLALARKHGFSEEEMKAHSSDLIKRFANRALGDTVFRVARDPLRKLGPNERLVGAARNCLAHGVEPVYIVKSIACALRFSDSRDESSLKLGAMLAKKGVDYVLEQVCGLAGGESGLRNAIKTELGRFNR